MEVSTTSLRRRLGKIIDQVVSGKEVTVTFRGRPMARIVPLRDDATKSDDEIFGMWKDRAGSTRVDHEVRSMRDGRTF